MRTARSIVTAVVLTLALTAPSLAAPPAEKEAKSVDIVGKFKAQGTNPGGKGSYSGDVTITKKGDIYQVVWSVGAEYTGTGILTGDVLSVAYTDAKKSWFGVVSYQVKDGGKKLVGQWTSHGGSKLGTETLTRQ